MNTQVPVSPATQTGGGGKQLRRVGFGAKNGDCSARATVTYAKYAPLQSPIFITQIQPRATLH